MERITFIGGGNMAAAIIGGMIASGYESKAISVVDPNPETRAVLQDTHGVAVYADAAEGCAGSDTIVLAVKPQVVATVAEAIRGRVDLNGVLLLSIVAGVTVETLARAFGPVSIARAMPNTPALLRAGATGLFLSQGCDAAQGNRARLICEGFGICVTVADEAQLDAVTALSGSGPAYFFLLIEEMTRSGVALGLAPEVARDLATQTALGAARMASEGDLDAAELRRQVTSPNGTTHAAITHFETQGFGPLVGGAMTAARDRARALSRG